MKILKWGFIGCGEVTETKSGPAFSEVGGSSVEAVMSRSEAKARSYAERHGVRTPPSSHATFAIMALKAGKPVYVE